MGPSWWTAGAVMVALLLVPAVSGSSANEPPPLWFSSNSDVCPTLNLRADDHPWPGEASQHALSPTGLFQVKSGFGLFQMPFPWTLESGETIRTTFTLEGLDELEPRPHPQSQTAMDEIDVLVEVRTTHFGEHGMDPNPNPHGRVAWTKQSFSSLEPLPARHDFDLSAVVNETVRYGPEESANLAVFIRVHGGESSTEPKPVTIRLTGEDGARVWVPGLPHDQMLAYQRAAVAAGLCPDLPDTVAAILPNLTQDAPGTSNEDTASTPTLAPALWVTLCLALLAVRRLVQR